MTEAYLTAREAAAELGVAPATLYAYVSRGLIRSAPQPGRRQRLYAADDVRRLKEGRGDGGASAAGSALDWGTPVLESGLTLIAGGRLFYRGHDAVDLARVARLEAVATLLWDSGAADPFAAPAPSFDPGGAAGLRDLPPLARAQALLPVVEAGDLRALDRTDAGLTATGARILRTLAGALSLSPSTDLPVHLAVARAWGVPERAELLRAALVLTADHELNASAFAVRVVASTGASLYASVGAGLAALSGPRHGGATERCGPLLRELAGADDPRAAVAERLRRGDDLPGFGHPLYPDGDPRGAALLDGLRASFPGDPDVGRMRAATRAASELSGRRPTVDWALAAVEWRLGLPRGAGLALFALGRTAGWIGHALEQYRQGRLIRPRARYVGLRGV